MTKNESSKQDGLPNVECSILRSSTGSSCHRQSKPSGDSIRGTLAKRGEISRLCTQQRRVPALRLLAFVICLFLSNAFAYTQQVEHAEQTETIVLVRHGEKPLGGLGQLACRGLNRALALPQVLVSKYGKPDYIFAPNPSVEIKDGNGPPYSYVRPLLTIAPTAVRLAMPINTQIGYDQIRELQDTLSQPLYGNSLIFIAWEHVLQVRFAKSLLSAYGVDPALVPSWKNTDYDSVWIFQIKQKDGKKTLTFKVDAEGLNDSLTDTCPNS